MNLLERQESYFFSGTLGFEGVAVVAGGVAGGVAGCVVGGGVLAGAVVAGVVVAGVVAGVVPAPGAGVAGVVVEEVAGAGTATSVGCGGKGLERMPAIISGSPASESL